MNMITFTIPPLDDDSIRNMAKSVTSDKDHIEILVDLAQGNPGAMIALTAMFTEDDALAPLCGELLLIMDIKGPMLWLLYKDVNGRDAKKTMEMVMDGDSAPRALAALPYAHFTWPRST